MASQQAEKAAELQDPEVRAELDRRVREEGATVIKGGAGGTSLEAQERLAEGDVDVCAMPRSSSRSAAGRPGQFPCWFSSIL